MKSTTIVLSTHNGADFLSALLVSLERQTFGDWYLLVRDDASNDSTPDILTSFKQRYPHKVEWIRDGCGAMGASRSFGALLEDVRTPYVLLCDQDDIWIPSKIEASLAAMYEAEARLGKNTPILVHGDLQVVDRDLRTLADSYWDYQCLNPRGGDFLNRLIVQNVVTGCTMAVNQALLKRALPVPAKAIMHDWWLALVARLFGEIVVIHQPLVLYRQHDANVVGARGAGIFMMLKKLNDLEGVCSRLLGTMAQAGELLERFSEDLTIDQKCLLRSYALLPEVSRLARVMALFKHRFFKAGMLRNAGLLITLLLMKRQKSSSGGGCKC